MKVLAAAYMIAIFLAICIVFIATNNQMDNIAESQAQKNDVYALLFSTTQQTINLVNISAFDMSGKRLPISAANTNGRFDSKSITGVTDALFDATNTEIQPLTVIDNAFPWLAIDATFNPDIYQLSIVGEVASCRNLSWRGLSIRELQVTSSDPYTSKLSFTADGLDIINYYPLVDNKTLYGNNGVPEGYTNFMV